MRYSLRYIFPFFFIPVLAAILPYCAVQFFGSPQLHGVFSADVFFLLLLLALPCGEIVFKLPFVVTVALYAIVSNSMEGFMTAAIYLSMILVTSFIPRKKWFLLPVFVLFALFFFVADCGVFFYSTFVLNIADIWGLAKYFWWGPVLFVAIPALQMTLELLFVRKILWGENRIELSHKVVIIVMLVTISLNFGVNQLQQRQPIMEFSVKNWMWQMFSPGTLSENAFLQENMRNAFPLWQGAPLVVTDHEKPTVFVLVESYGVNKSVVYTDSLLAPFKNSDAQFLGLFSRKASHTQGAEWEDFGSVGGIIKETPLPQKFKDRGLQTWYLHGYNGGFYERRVNYAKFGFDSLFFHSEFKTRGLAECHYGFAGICDSSIINFMDSLLTDSTPKFIYWTTLDAHPPYELADGVKKSSACESLHFSDLDCTYFTLQQNTEQRLASLANRHPEYRFIIRGDHRPMGSMVDVDFVQSFYFKWVPMIVLNR